MITPEMQEFMEQWMTRFENAVNQLDDAARTIANVGENLPYNVQNMQEAANSMGYAATNMREAAGTMLMAGRH